MNIAVNITAAPSAQSRWDAAVAAYEAARIANEQASDACGRAWRAGLSESITGDDAPLSRAHDAAFRAEAATVRQLIATPSPSEPAFAMKLALIGLHADALGMSWNDDLVAGLIAHGRAAHDVERFRQAA